MPAGKVAFVTGASTGIGRAIAIALAGEGVAVGLCARSEAGLRDTAEACRAAGASVCVVPADLRSSQSVTAALENVERELGPIDTLVNSAGVSQPERQRLEDLDEAQWTLNQDTNVRGTYLTCHHVVGRMKARGQGAVINIGSTASHRTLAGVTAYAASKHAVRALTEGLAEECDGTGVKVHLISPGPVDTPIWDKKPEPPSADFRASILRPEDIADIALWLLSRPARVRIDEILVRPTATSPTELD